MADLMRSCPVAILLTLVAAIPSVPAVDRPSVDVAPVTLPDGTALPAEITPNAYHKVQKGLNWLLLQQNKDGSWGCERAGVPSAAVTGLACLALMSTGDTPDRGTYSTQIGKALVWMLRICDPKTGQIMANESQTGMGVLYGHATGTLFLAEVYGMSPREDVKEKLEKAVKFTCKHQNPDGGWGEGQSDLAITGAMYMTLRSARSAGIMIPSQPFEKFERFLARCKNDDGGFRQFPSQPGNSMFYPTSAALRVMYGVGKGETAEVQRATKWMLTRNLGQDYGGRISEWCYCGAFYAAAALMIDEGAPWKTWFPKMRDHLCRIQNADGSWTIEYCSHCKAYATALALCTLQAPYRVLPIYQL